MLDVSILKVIFPGPIGRSHHNDDQYYEQFLYAKPKHNFYLFFYLLFASPPGIFILKFRWQSRQYTVEVPCSLWQTVHAISPKWDL